MIETTETHGTVEGEYRAWYAGADTKERVDQLKTYMRDAYRAKQLLELRAHREHGFLASPTP